MAVFLSVVSNPQILVLKGLLDSLEVIMWDHKSCTSLA